jgi:S-(hydroxymethyl)glutathione dehydrogenase/alcohol dehydrogenase
LLPTRPQDPYDLIFGKNIEGSWGASTNPDVDIPELGQLYRNGKLPLEKLLSRGYKLDEINQAINDLEGSRVIRAVIRMTDE